ncbi:MAG TPA: autorepressor SdpR family transcription factor [Flavobacteriales bacterium]|jgi:ArsR family transcriptional regulator|nr:autorepressor SdpR family transcription factor [Flavobacteriales bacterium]
MNKAFKALNDPTRRRILELLRQCDMTAGDIANEFDMSFPSVSHHLDQLRQAGLVASMKEGQFVRYSLNTTVVDEMIGWMLALKTPPKRKR